MAFRFAAITNKKNSQIIKQAVPETHEEGYKIWLGSFNRYMLSVWLEFSDETGEKVCITLFSRIGHK